jgi:hypothetical protein
MLENQQSSHLADRSNERIATIHESPCPVNETLRCAGAEIFLLPESISGRLTYNAGTIKPGSGGILEITLNFEFINWLSVLAATFIVFVLGGIWYSPAVFGRIGLSAQTKSAGGRNIQAIFVVAFILQFLTAALLAAVLGPNATVGYGLTVGLLIGCFFVTTALGISNIFDNRPLIRLAVNGGYHIVSFATMAVVICAWQ